jgi:hypothetical protein
MERVGGGAPKVHNKHEQCPTSTERCNPSEKELFSKSEATKSFKLSPWTLLSLVHLMRWLSRELKHLVMVFGPKSCFADFRILRFPLTVITVGKCMVGWLARHGWWCKQASTFEQNKPWSTSKPDFDTAQTRPSTQRE